MEICRERDKVTICRLLIIWEALKKSPGRTTRFTRRTHSQNSPQVQKSLDLALQKGKILGISGCYRFEAVNIAGNMCQTTLPNRQCMSPSDVTV